MGKTYPRKDKSYYESHQVFEYRSPTRSRCCCCGCKLGPDKVIDRRPTGSEGKIQDWPFCPSCYALHLEATLIQRPITPREATSWDSRWIHFAEAVAE